MKQYDFGMILYVTVQSKRILYGTISYDTYSTILSCFYNENKTLPNKRIFYDTVWEESGTIQFSVIGKLRDNRIWCDNVWCRTKTIGFGMIQTIQFSMKFCSVLCLTVGWKRFVRNNSPLLPLPFRWLSGAQSYHDLQQRYRHNGRGAAGGATSVWGVNVATL